MFIVTCKRTNDVLYRSKFLEKVQNFIRQTHLEDKVRITFVSGNVARRRREGALAT